MTLNELIENFNTLNLAIFLNISGSGDLNEPYSGQNPYYKGATLLAHILFLRDKPSLRKLLSIKGDLAEALDFIPVDVNRPSCWGEPALLYAIYAIVDLEIIEILLKNGANVNRRNRKYLDMTPLMEGRYRLDLAALLIQYKANVNAQDNRKKTVLMQAISDDNGDLVELLMANGAYGDTQDEQDQTAFAQPILSSPAAIKLTVSAPNDSKESPVNVVLPPSPKNTSNPSTPKTKRKR